MGRVLFEGAGIVLKGTSTTTIVEGMTRDDAHQTRKKMLLTKIPCHLGTQERAHPGIKRAYPDEDPCRAGVGLSLAFAEYFSWPFLDEWFCFQALPSPKGIHLKNQDLA